MTGLFCRPAAGKQSSEIRMPTETIDPRFEGLDGWPLPQAMEAIWDGQLAAISAIKPALPAITAATQAAADMLKRGGRLIYAGAGTSGRIAAQDAAELTPTFDWPAARAVILLAGGSQALLASVEGAEDDRKDAIARLQQQGLSQNDVAIGIAASGRTPFTVAAIQYAAECGALTIGIANNPGTPLLSASRHPILVETGSELIAGSTRMKAGTAQKAVLNLISTGIMLRLGKVYRGMMVNMQIANEKLQSRAIEIIMRITDCQRAVAVDALDKSGHDLKLAILLAFGAERGMAEKALAAHDGNLRHAIAAIQKRA